MVTSEVSSAGVSSSGMSTAAPTLAGATSSVAPAGGPAVAAATGAVSVPVTVTTASGTGTALDGAVIATVQVVVGGGEPITVRLDTGSSGLLIDAAEAGPQTTNTGEAISTEFGGSTAQGTLGRAQVALGAISTAAPIGVTLVDTAQGAPPTFAGTSGLLGVGTTDSPTSVPTQVWAPTLQLPSPADQGVELDITDGATGTLTLGPPATPAGTTVLPLTRVSGSSDSYPGGGPGWSRMVQLCWVVGSAASNCAATDLDTGNPVVGLSASAFPSLGALDTILPAGQPISVTAPGGPTLFSATSGKPVSPETLLLTGLGEATYNTGIGLFLGAVVGIDYVGGRILVTPRG